MVDSPLRVLYVVPGIGRSGGMERSLVAIAPQLMRLGIELHVAYLIRTCDVENDLRAAGISIHDLTGPDTVPARARRVRRTIRRIQPSIVHSVLYDAEVPARLASIGMPVVSLSTWASTPYEHDAIRLAAGPPRWKREFVRLVDAGLAALTRSHFHAVTEGVAGSTAAALHVPMERVHVVGRGRDLGEFRAPDNRERAHARAILGVSDDVTVLLCVARQVKAKGHVFLLQAFDHVAFARSNVQLVLVGPDGAATQDIQRTLTTMQHRDRVIQLGARTDVSTLLHGADAFVLASLYEGAGGALLEALGSEVPVVATDIVGYRGWLEHGTHVLLAAPGDVGSLSARILECIDDPTASRIRTTAGRHLVEERFSVERAAADLAELYRSLDVNTVNARSSSLR